MSFEATCASDKGANDEEIFATCALATVVAIAPVVFVVDHVQASPFLVLYTTSCDVYMYFINLFANNNLAPDVVFENAHESAAVTVEYGELRVVICPDDCPWFLTKVVP